MAAGTIEHSELPDNLLHEPKGASTAENGTLYVANGLGSGEFKKVPVESLDMTIQVVAGSSNVPVTGTVEVTGDTLTEVALGRLQDVLPHAEIPSDVTSKINQNTAELFEIYTNQKIINGDLKTAITTLRSDLNRVIIALKNEGIFRDE